MSFHCTKLWFWRNLDMHSYNINVIITILLVLRPWIVSPPTAFIAFQSTTTCIWYAIWTSFLLAWLCTFIFLVNLYPSGSINTEIIKKYVLARKLLLDMTQTFEQIMVIMKKNKKTLPDWTYYQPCEIMQNKGTSFPWKELTWRHLHYKGKYIWKNTLYKRSKINIK